MPNNLPDLVTNVNTSKNKKRNMSYDKGTVGSNVFQKRNMSYDKGTVGSNVAHLEEEFKEKFDEKQNEMKHNNEEYILKIQNEAKLKEIEIENQNMLEKEALENQVM